MASHVCVHACVLCKCCANVCVSHSQNRYLRHANFLSRFINNRDTSLQLSRARKQLLSEEAGGWAYFCLIKGMLIELAAATAANGTKRPIREGKRWGEVPETLQYQ